MGRKADMRQTASRRVLITGCSSGFGLLTAVRAAKEGFDVVATVRDLRRSEVLEHALEAAGTKATIDQMDVTDAGQIKRIAEKYSPLDVLVNNAGILVTGSFLDLSDQEVRQIFETNYFGAMALTRAVAGPMLERRQGRIINVASLAGIVGYPYNAAYAASKHALIGFSQSIRVELAPFGVEVISVEPGFHWTKILCSNARVSEHFYDRQNPLFEYNRGYLRAMTEEMLPWASRPETVADCIVRLMSLPRPRGRYVIGRDARVAMLCRWLGLMGWLERFVVHRIDRARRVEIARESRRKAGRRLQRQRREEGVTTP